MDVVDNGRGVGATERGVRAPAIVEVDERRQGSKPGGVGGVRPGVGPFTDEGPDEPLGLAVGLRPVGSRPGLPAPGEGGPVLVARYAQALSVITRSTAMPSSSNVAIARRRAAAALAPLSSGTWTTTLRRLRSSTMT